MKPQVIHGNALNLAACGIPDGSVDLIVTSPPYFGLRSYQDGGEHYAGQIGAEATPAEFVDALIAATREMVRVLKPSGSIFVNLGDKYDKTKSLLNLPHRYVIAVRDRLGLVQRSEIVWSKPNGMPEPVKDRMRRDHEMWFHLTLSGSYFASIDTIRERPLTAGAGLSWGNRKQSLALRADDKRQDTVVGLNNAKANHPLGRPPGSVRSVTSERLRLPTDLGVRHPAAFPMEWPKLFIKGWCPAAGVVLDPFGGTGTTATVAHALGRHGITVDLSRDYCRVAQWRTTDPGQLAKARQEPKPRPVVVTTGQGDVEVPADEPTLLDLIEGDAA